MAGSVTPEGAEQLVAVVTEGECRMLMRLARSWAAEGSWRGETPLPPAVVRPAGDRGWVSRAPGPWMGLGRSLEFQEWARGEAAVDGEGEGFRAWDLDLGGLEEVAGTSWGQSQWQGRGTSEQGIRQSKSWGPHLCYGCNLCPPCQELFCPQATPSSCGLLPQLASHHGNK